MSGSVGASGFCLDWLVGFLDECPSDSEPVLSRSAVYLELGDKGHRLLASSAPEVLVQLPKRNRPQGAAKRKPSKTRGSNNKSKLQRKRPQQSDVIEIDSDDEPILSFVKRTRRKGSPKRTDPVPSDESSCEAEFD